MSIDVTPVLDGRTADETLTGLRKRRPSFVREWHPREESAGEALLRVVARYAQVVADRLNQAPDRNLLAFLSQLGIGLIPARPARAPVVFKTFAGLADGHAPAGTRVGANVPEAPSPIVFETEEGVALAAARLTDVFAVWPDRDAYVDHSADVAGGRPFQWDRPMSQVPHALYLAHDTVFDVATTAAIELAFELSTPGSAALSVVWEYWDGQVWQAFKPFDSSDPAASRDGTAGFVRSGTVTLLMGCGRPVKTSVMGINARWVRGRLDQPLPPDPARVLAELDRVRVRAAVQDSGTLPADAAYANGIKVDVSGTFQPFGGQPIPGSTFHVACAQAFAKSGAIVTVYWQLADPRAADGLKPIVRWQYWNGDAWVNLEGVKQDKAYFGDSGPTSITFTVPSNMAATEVSGQQAIWLRARLVSGKYGNKVEIPVGAAGDTIQFEELVPPALQVLQISYRWRPASQPVEQCCTYNDFQWAWHSQDVRWPGNAFPPFQPVTDAVPTLYLGFDRPLPNDRVSVYVDVEETAGELSAIVWDAWDGYVWRALPIADETAAFARSGMVSFIPPPVSRRPTATVKTASGSRALVSSALELARFQPGQLVVVAQDDKKDVVRIASVEDRTATFETPLGESYTSGTLSLAALPRFGAPRDWVRARLKDNGAAPTVTVDGLYLNAAWAAQTETITGEVIGSGNGQPGQTLFFSHFPILPDEQIEVRELEGARAHVELPTLRDELIAAGFNEDDIRTVSDPRTGKVREVWVRWRSRPHLFFSSPEDRHYVVERARGRLLFGDRINGRLATVGVDNVRARVYRAAGGLVGNVSRGAINQMLGGAFAESVSNPRAAAGGADGEQITAVKRRGPETLRHRWRALSARDHEAMAREASPGVAAVRVLPATALNKLPAPGWVTVIIVPQSRDPQPQPSLELRTEVHDYLAERCPATLAARHIAVIGPTYRPVGVAALVAPRVLGDAGVVGHAIEAALKTFLHPLTGGPEGRGWDFGRDVFLSDVAAILEAVDGVDCVRQLDLLLDGAPAGPRVPIPPDEIVVAGVLRIEMEAPEA